MSAVITQLSRSRRADIAELGRRGQLNIADLEARAVVLHEGPRLFTEKGMMRHHLGAKATGKRGCPTGIRELDKKSGGGIQAGHVWLLGAQTSWGKTSAAISFADESMAAGKHVLIVSFEDVESMYGDRLMAKRTQISAQKIRDREFSPTEQQRIIHMANSADYTKPAFLNAIGCKVEQVAKTLKLVLSEFVVDLVILDYAQEFYSEERHQDRTKELKYCVGLLTGTIKAANASGLLLSQLTVSDKSKPPDINSYRDCKDMANKAEAAFLGTESDGAKKLECVKLKNGERNWSVNLTWHGSSASFRPDYVPGQRDHNDLEADFEDGNGF